MAGDYYLYIMIDNLSCSPVVQVVQFTKLSELRPELDENFTLFMVPVSVTHDGGAPYNSDDWLRYTREKGFKPRLCTPEWFG